MSGNGAMDGGVKLTARTTAGIGKPRTTAERAVLNAMTVDVEEYFQVSAFEGHIARDDWDHIPTRLDYGLERVLDLLAEFDVLGTFFILGWIADRHPASVKRIADAGHEIACHGYSHRLVYDQQQETFRDETVRARATLQDVSGQPVEGYRAASFSIRGSNLWALDVLVEAGFTYDSSLFPVIHDRYGIPGAPRRIHRLRTPAGHTLNEVPPSTVELGPFTLPAAGGGYLRILPGAITNWSIRRLNLRENMPAVVYVHPWELDPEQPRIDVPYLTRLRHYFGIATTDRKLRDLLGTYRFGPVRAVLQEVLGNHHEAGSVSASTVGELRS